MHILSKKQEKHCGIYIDKRKHFDRMVQKPKSLYWFKIQSDLLMESNYDQNEFWRSIGKIRIGTQRSIPMETTNIPMGDGSISHNTNDELNK